MTNRNSESDAGIVARIISPSCDDLDHLECDGKMCGCACHEGHPCGHTSTTRGCGGCDPSPGPCWRAECRAACYYPQACSEKPEPCIAPPGNLCTDTGCWDADKCIATRVLPPGVDQGEPEEAGA